MQAPPSALAIRNRRLFNNSPYARTFPSSPPSSPTSPSSTSTLQTPVVKSVSLADSPARSPLSRPFSSPYSPTHCTISTPPRASSSRISAFDFSDSDDDSIADARVLIEDCFEDEIRRETKVGVRRALEMQEKAKSELQHELQENFHSPEPAAFTMPAFSSAASMPLQSARDALIKQKEDQMKRCLAKVRELKRAHEAEQAMREKEEQARRAEQLRLAKEKEMALLRERQRKAQAEAEARARIEADAKAKAEAEERRKAEHLAASQAASSLSSSSSASSSETTSRKTGPWIGISERYKGRYEEIRQLQADLAEQKTVERKERMPMNKQLNILKSTPDSVAASVKFFIENRLLDEDSLCKLFADLCLNYIGHLNLTGSFDAGWHVSLLVRRLADRKPRFAHIFHAQLCQLCPYVVPVYLPVDRQGRRVLRTGELEGDDAYFKRMDNYVAFFAMMSQWPGSAPREAPIFDLSHLWCWLARLLNTQPTSITPIILKAAIKSSSYSLQRAFGTQFDKMVSLVFKRVLPMLEKTPGAAISTITNISTFLEDARKSRRFEPPDDNHRKFSRS